MNTKYGILVFFAFIFSMCMEEKKSYVKNLIENKSIRDQVFNEIIQNQFYTKEFNTAIKANKISFLFPLLFTPSIQLQQNKDGNYEINPQEMELLKNIVSELNHARAEDSINCIMTYHEVIHNGHLKSYTLNHTCGKGKSKEK